VIVPVVVVSVSRLHVMHALTALVSQWSVVVKLRSVWSVVLTVNASQRPGVVHMTADSVSILTDVCGDDRTSLQVCYSRRC